jgi:hypothetical protein
VFQSFRRRRIIHIHKQNQQLFFHHKNKKQMAQQKGLHKIIGTIGDATYVKTKDGFQVKAKSEVPKSTFNSAASMVRTRENAAEFGRAGQAGKLFRLAIRSLLKYAKDRRVTARLTGKMLQVIKADATSTRGMRNVIDGEAELLKDFEFNKDAPLSMTFPTKINTSINRDTGQLNVDIPAFIPALDVVAPEGSTHFKIVSMGAEIDFENKTYITAESSSPVIPINTVPVAASTLTNAVTVASTHPLFLMLGIQFFQQVNGTDYPLKNGAYNALALVDVNGA